MGSQHLIGLAGRDSFAERRRARRISSRCARARRSSRAFNALQRTIVWAVALGVVLALVFALCRRCRSAGPVRLLAIATRQLQEGNYSVDTPVQSRDEIGILANPSAACADLKAKAALVDYIDEASGSAATPADSWERRRGARRGWRVAQPGSVFAGRYEVKEILGIGGMGVVYARSNRELQEPVAIKTSSRRRSRAGGALDRFKQEIRLGAQDSAHRNVVRTYDLGEQNGMYYLTWITSRARR